MPVFIIAVALILCIPLLGTDKHKTLAAPNSSPASVSSSSTDEKFKLAGLTDLRGMNAGFVFDVRYATTNNFTGKKLYDKPRSFLRDKTALKLAAANQDFIKLGYKIKIFDAYRPYSIQKTLYSYISYSQRDYIANPYSGGSNHNRAAAVDITLVNLDGSPVLMPTDFDTFSYTANINYTGCGKERINNRELLASMMLKHGFCRINCEWWHFDDTDALKYSLLDLKF